MFDTWTVENYGGEYDIPTGITYTDEQSEELNTLTGDLTTYISEAYLGFLEGSKPLSEWDAYIADLEAMGIGRCREIIQEAYDAYMA